eukprot:13018-Heterococcus_DN1.PRE.2
MADREASIKVHEHTIYSAINTNALLRQHYLRSRCNMGVHSIAKGQPQSATTNVQTVVITALTHLSMLVCTRNASRGGGSTKSLL